MKLEIKRMEEWKQQRDSCIVKGATNEEVQQWFPKFVGLLVEVPDCLSIPPVFQAETKQELLLKIHEYLIDIRTTVSETLDSLYKEYRKALDAT